MGITLAGGSIQPPPSNNAEKLSSRVTYKTPSGSTWTSIDSYVTNWVTIEEIDKPISVAKINVAPSFLIADLDTTIVDGSEIKIFIGDQTPDTLWFHGYKVSLEKDGITSIIHCKSKGIEMDRREVSQDFVQYNDPVYSGRLTEIAKWIIDNKTTLDSQGIQYDAVKTSQKIIADNTPVIEILSMIKDALDWNLWERLGVVYMQPRGTIDNNITLTVGDTVKKLSKWESDQSEMVNSLTVYGAPETHSTTELFTGDGSADQSFTLTYPHFTDVKVEYTADGGTTWTEKIGAIPGVTSSYDYTSHPEASQKKITFDGTTGFAPAAAADNVRITYSHPWQVPYTITNSSSINTYGKYEKTITRSDLQTQQDIEQFATQYIAAYKDPINIGKLLCRRTDVVVGEQITVVDSRNNINGAFTISKMELQYPDYRLILDVSDTPKLMGMGDWRKGLDERVRRLEERQRGYSAATRTTLGPYQVSQTITNKITKITIKSRTAGSSFILNYTTANGNPEDRCVLGGAGVGTGLGDNRGVLTTESTTTF